MKKLLHAEVQPKPCANHFLNILQTTQVLLLLSSTHLDKENLKKHRIMESTYTAIPRPRMKDESVEHFFQSMITEMQNANRIRTAETHLSSYRSFARFLSESFGRRKTGDLKKDGESTVRLHVYLGIGYVHDGEADKACPYAESCCLFHGFGL